MLRAILICLISLLLGLPASAQFDNCGLGFCSPIVASGTTYTGPGDVVSGWTFWYGLRAFNAAYATAGSNAIIARNTATNETCNVPVTSSGGLGNVSGCSGSSSGDTLSVFCAESSGTCAITTATDQTGNGHTLTQATAADQPTLTLSCLSSLPCFTGNGTSMYMSGSSVGGSPSAFSFSVVSEKTSSSTEAGLINLGSNNPELYYCCSDGNVRLIGASGFTASVSDNAWHALNATINGSSSFIHVDATATTGSIASVATLSAIYFMGENSGTHPLAGNVAEAGGLSTSITSTQAGNLCHNQYTYWGTPTSC
jgi:hypothetical protein